MGTGCDHSRQMRTTEGWVCEDCFHIIDPTSGDSLRTLGPASLDSELAVIADQAQRRQRQAAEDAATSRMMEGRDW